MDTENGDTSLEGLHATPNARCSIHGARAGTSFVRLDDRGPAQSRPLGVLGNHGLKMGLRLSDWTIGTISESRRIGPSIAAPTKGCLRGKVPVGVFFPCSRVTKTARRSTHSSPFEPAESEPGT